MALFDLVIQIDVSICQAGQCLQITLSTVPANLSDQLVYGYYKARAFNSALLVPIFARVQLLIATCSCTRIRETVRNQRKLP